MMGNGESLWRVCPNCGLLSPAENEACECGYRFQTKYLKTAARKTPQDPAYYVEAANGMIVRVSEKNLSAWSEAQRNANGPLTPAEENLLNRTLELLYEPKENILPTSQEESEGSKGKVPSGKPLYVPDISGKTTVYTPGGQIPKKKHSAFGVLIMIAILVASIAYVLNIAPGGIVGTTPKTVATARPTVPTKTAPPRSTVAPRTVTPRPRSAYNGQVFTKPIYEGQCPFTVSTTGSSGGYYVYLRYVGESTRSIEGRSLTGNKSDDSGGLTLGTWWNAVASNSNSDIAFYVEAGKSVDLDVPVGKYRFSYAFGETWYGQNAAKPYTYFGENTSFYTSDELLEFFFDGTYYNGHTISLWKQVGGNFSTESISGDEFPA